MISIIICSINENRFNQLELNITETIGDIEFEIIKLDNKVEKLSITKAYNKGADSAQFKNLLFIHEDILFHTFNWGIILSEELKDEETGIVGIAGSCYSPFAPSGFTNPVKDYNFHFLIQRTEKGNISFSKFPSTGQKIKAIDGVFIGIRRDVYDKNKFNENLVGFHGYDLDFSLRISQQNKNKITKKILIEHFSMGSPNEDFIRNNISIKRSIKIKNEFNDTFNEYSTFRVFVKSLYSNNFARNEIKELSKEFRSINRFGFINYLKSYYFTFREKFYH